MTIHASKDLGKKFSGVKQFTVYDLTHTVRSRIESGLVQGWEEDGSEVRVCVCVGGGGAN